MSRTLLITSLLALLLGVCVGALSLAEPALLPLVELCHLVGQLFLRALMLLVVPLVLAALIHGAMRLGSSGSFGKLGSFTLLSFLFCMALAVAWGMATTAYFLSGDQITASKADSALSTVQTAKTALDGWGRADLLLQRIVPKNLIAAASQNQIIGLIGFCLFFGSMASRSSTDEALSVRRFWSGTFEIMVSMTHKLMAIMPLGIFALLVDAVGNSSTGDWRQALHFTLIISLSLVLYALFMLCLTHLICRASPLATLRQLTPALLTAFSTSSSAVALPSALEGLHNLNVPNRISSLVMPLGITINLAGSAVYVSAVVTFIAITSSAADSLHWPLLYSVLLFSCLGMAGIPSAALITTLVVLQTLELPEKQLAYFLALDRFIDMLRTTVNILTSSLVAKTISCKMRLS